MRPDAGWGTVQMPAFVASSQPGSYTDPALKAREAADLRRDVEAFLRNGGTIEPPDASLASRRHRGG